MKPVYLIVLYALTAIISTCTYLILLSGVYYKPQEIWLYLPTCNLEVRNERKMEKKKNSLLSE